MEFQKACEDLRDAPQRWLVTGAAGFIGSNLVEFLLGINQHVVGLDNFSTGYRHNLEDVKDRVGKAAWSRFSFIESDICNADSMTHAIEGVDYVLHQAALGSVPKSIENPLRWNKTNVDGFLVVLEAAKNQRVKGFVYASSSSVYGDSADLPKRENIIGNQLSPYAVSKYVDELYAGVFWQCYGFKSIGLRYFNVFGARQDPKGAYAAVIPRWIANIEVGEPCIVNGDGETTRDFCYIKNVIQANILAATKLESLKSHHVFNVGVGENIDLITLYQTIIKIIEERSSIYKVQKLFFKEFRPGDIRHSLADIGEIQAALGYQPTHTVRMGLEECIQWYLQDAPLQVKDRASNHDWNINTLQI